VVGASGQSIAQAQALPPTQAGVFGQGYAQAQVYPQAAAYPQPVYPQASPQASPQSGVYAQAQPVLQARAGVPVAQPAAWGQPTAAVRPAQVATQTKQADSEKKSDEEQEELAEVVVKNAPPWLFSAIVHLLAVILFSLIIYVNIPRARIELKASTAVPEEDWDNAIYAEKLGKQLEFDSPYAGNDPSKVEEPVITPPNLPEVQNPFATPGKALTTFADGTTATSEVVSTSIGFALAGREIGSKRFLCAAYGGTKTTEEVVQRGLLWLAKQQDKRDGSWSLVGPYTNGATTGDNQTAATAMALLAFQGDGNTHKQGKFKDNVARGWEWLLKRQDGEGCFFREDIFMHRFYTQGQCTIAICELYAMSKDKKYEEPAQRAVDYCVKNQSKEGGWRYSPQVDSDISVTGWIVMALQSARMAGLKVPKETLDRVERFLDRAGKEGGGSRYPYQIGEEPRRSMTAEALLCRQYLGWRRDDPRLIEGVKYLTEPENLIDYKKNRDVYYWYYATQVCHHMEGEFWKTWNKVMRQVVCEQQVKRGPEAGSWDPHRPSPDAWASHGGRLYVTCLSIYMLEVYYRHLPLYSNVYKQLRALAPSPAAP